MCCAVGMPCGPTVCVTCVWAGVDNVWEQEKPEARKMLENVAESHTSDARFVGRHPNRRQERSETETESVGMSVRGIKSPFERSRKRLIQTEATVMHHVNSDRALGLTLVWQSGPCLPFPRRGPGCEKQYVE